MQQHGNWLAVGMLVCSGAFGSDFILDSQGMVTLQGSTRRMIGPAELGFVRSFSFPLDPNLGVTANATRAAFLKGNTISIYDQTSKAQLSTITPSVALDDVAYLGGRLLGV